MAVEVLLKSLARRRYAPVWRNTSFAVPVVRLPLLSAGQLSWLPLKFKPLERVTYALSVIRHIAPPLPVVLLSMMVHFSRVNVEFWNARPPPLLFVPVALLPLMVQLVIELSPLLMANMPPPSPSHVLLLMVLFSILSLLCASLIYRPPPEAPLEVLVSL